MRWECIGGFIGGLIFFKPYQNNPKSFLIHDCNLLGYFGFHRIVASLRSSYIPHRCIVTLEHFRQKTGGTLWREARQLKLSA